MVLYVHLSSPAGFDGPYGVSGAWLTSFLCIVGGLAAIKLAHSTLVSLSSVPGRWPARAVSGPIGRLLREGPSTQTDVVSRLMSGAFCSRFRTKSHWSLSHSSICKRISLSSCPTCSENIHRTYIYLVRRVSHHLLFFRDGGQVPYP